VQELEGSWAPLAAEVSGQLLDVAELRVARLIFSADRYAITGHGDQIVDAGTWLLGAPADPRAIDLIGSDGPNAGRRVCAIIRLDGDRLCLGYDLEREQRPAGWRHEPEQLLLCITYARDDRRRPRK
jgi:uncharacterized protein (TIGR03067 family)